MSCFGYDTVGTRFPSLTESFILWLYVLENFWSVDQTYEYTLDYYTTFPVRSLDNLFTTEKSRGWRRRYIIPASFHLCYIIIDSHKLKASMLWTARKNSYLIVVTAESAACLSYHRGIVLPIAYCISTLNTPCCTVYTYLHSGAETHHKTSE